MVVDEPRCVEIPDQKAPDRPLSVLSKVRNNLHLVENYAGAAVLLLIALIPAIEAVMRKTVRTGIHGSADYVQHLVIWVTFIGGMLTSREGRHLALGVGVDLVKQPLQGWLKAFSSAVAGAVAASLALTSWQFVTTAFPEGAKVGVIPLPLVMMVMPLGFAVMAVRFFSRGPRAWYHRVLTAAGPALAIAAVLFNWTPAAPLKWPLIGILTAAGLLGAPVFTVLSGIAIVLFSVVGGAPAIIANEAYTMLSGPAIPTIPLFALTGFILSESKAGERLVDFFRAAFGWLPGGMAVMAVAVCAFFTTFTGASGVTILALGGLLSFVLVQSGYRRGFATGMLTSSGSIGLLFPPSLPIILYGVVAQLNIKHFFIAGLVPGLLLSITVASLGIHHAIAEKVKRTPFEPVRIGKAFIGAAWEIALPLVVLLFYFGGITTLVETSSLAAVYALAVVVIIRKDFSWHKVPDILVKCMPTVGGVLVILAIARGLSYYIIDAEVPTQLAAWAAETIRSKYLFLAVLNIALLIVGCFMDIFSAIVVVVPLIIPLAETFGVHPLHLGIIFLANLELGYLTPPVGINLFLASYRFELPLSSIYRQVVPFIITRLIAVLLITYAPWFTTVLLDLFGIAY